jgi:RHS repeat-associated protein
VDPRGSLSQTLYDAAGNTAAVIDADGNQTSYVYDGDNRLSVTTDPYGKATTTSYDAAGRVTKVVDPDNRTITYAYDAANRETSETWLSSGGATVNTRTYSYDAANNLLTAADNAGTYTMGYDALNRLTSEAEPFGVSLTYSYDQADRRTQVQDSAGGTLTSVYDNGNRLTSRQLNTSSQQLRIDPGYDARNDMTSLTRYSNTAGTVVVGTTVYAYDDATRLTAITNKNGSGATLSYYNPSYDTANRITTETWSSGASNGTLTYTYDAASQLISDGATTFSYDLNGNRTMAGYQTATGNRLSTDGTWTYTYDAAGNEIQKTQGSGSSAVTWTYGYDNLNHLVTATEVTATGTAVQATYTYDVFGNRVQESEYTSASGLTTVTRHAYDGSNIWADLNSSNGVIARYVYGDSVNQVWARMIPSGQANSGVAWYLTDRQGSVRDLMDNAGTLQDHIEYNGFGGVVTETNTSFSDHFKYDAGWYDPSTGWTNFINRWYDPATGRWTSQDPLGFGAGDGNLYRYVNNNTPNKADPSGLQPRELNEVSAPEYKSYPVETLDGKYKGFIDIGLYASHRDHNNGIYIAYRGSNAALVYGIQFVSLTMRRSRKIGPDEPTESWYLKGSIETIIRPISYSPNPGRPIIHVDAVPGSSAIQDVGGLWRPDAQAEDGWGINWFYDAPGFLFEPGYTDRFLSLFDPPSLEFQTLKFTYNFDTYLIAQTQDGPRAFAVVSWATTQTWSKAFLLRSSYSRV